jgi:L-aminopeptidase/D-esterase-like protein
MTETPGPRNLITDVVGLRVGNAEDMDGLSGVTVLVPDRVMTVAADIRGGAPGGRETGALEPENLVEEAHAIVLSGGSVFGLDAASAVTTLLARQGRGFRFGDQAWPCPVVPGAVLFDLMNGGDKTWTAGPPYRALGERAMAAAAPAFEIGNAGAGLGAISGSLKGGLGSASATNGAFTVGALVAVNSVGSCVNPRTGRLWADDHALGEEMGPGKARPMPALSGTKVDLSPEAARPGANTTIAVVATDAALTKSEAKRLAIMAADGFGIAIRPAHTPFDGDTVFAAAMGATPLPDNRALALGGLGAMAARCLARAIGRAIWHAASAGRAQSYRAILGA